MEKGYTHIKIKSFDFIHSKEICVINFEGLNQVWNFPMIEVKKSGSKIGKWKLKTLKPALKF